MITKPRSRRAESITQEEKDVHHWLARLAVCLSIVGQETTDKAMSRHVRKTIDEFTRSSACSDTLEKHLRP